jgi:hypothetical protein
MPDAVVLARGRLTNATVNLNAILSDTNLAAQPRGNYAVWSKRLT